VRYFKFGKVSYGLRLIVPDSMPVMRHCQKLFWTQSAVKSESEGAFGVSSYWTLIVQIDVPPRDHRAVLIAADISSLVLTQLPGQLNELVKTMPSFLIGRKKSCLHASFSLFRTHLKVAAKMLR